MNKIEQAIEQMNSGDVDHALQLLQQFIESATDDEKFMVANLYYDWGFFEEAIDLLETLLKIYPKEGQLITKLAEMYIELEKDENAVNLLNEIEEDDPFYLQSLLQVADLYHAQGLFEVAEQKLLQAKQIDPEEKVIDFALGELLFATGKYHRAIPFYEKIVNEVLELNNISIKERLAESYALLGHYEQALSFYSQIDSQNPDTLFKHGFTAYQQKRNDIAINIWKQLLDIDPHYHAVYPELANAMREEEMIDEAFAVVEQGLTYDEFNKELYFLAGQLAITRQKDKEAISYLQEAISLDLDYQEAILLLIQVYKENDVYTDVINLLTEIKQAGANDPLYDWELARAYCEEECFQEAHKAYEDASIHLMHDRDFLKEYGYFLIEEGLHKKAIPILEKYIKLEPTDEETISFLERLKFSIDE